MINKLTVYEVTVWDDGQIAYRQSFLGKPKRDKLVEAICHEAGRERGLAGSWVSGLRATVRSAVHAWRVPPSWMRWHSRSLRVQ